MSEEAGSGRRMRGVSHMVAGLALLVMLNSKVWVFFTEIKFLLPRL